MRHDAHYVEELTQATTTHVGRMLPIDKLDPNPDQPRTEIGDLTELTSSIRQKGVLLNGRETSSQLDDLMTAIDRFEAAVVGRGGDLFVNTPFSDQPESPDFVIPRRISGEDAEAYASRVNAAAARLEKVDL